MSLFVAEVGAALEAHVNGKVPDTAGEYRGFKPRSVSKPVLEEIESFRQSLVQELNAPCELALFTLAVRGAVTTKKVSNRSVFGSEAVPPSPSQRQGVPSAADAERASPKRDPNSKQVVTYYWSVEANDQEKGFHAKVTFTFVCLKNGEWLRRSRTLAFESRGLDSSWVMLRTQ
jgi:hypothetical protein